MLKYWNGHNSTGIKWQKGDNIKLRYKFKRIEKGFVINFEEKIQKLFIINKFQLMKQDTENMSFSQDINTKGPKERINTLWSKQENLIYIEFLKQHREIFTTEEIRRHHKVFIQLAKLLPSRTSDQCRSHHQKMMISHKSIEKIIKHLNKKIAKYDKKHTKITEHTETDHPMESEHQEPKINEKNLDVPNTQEITKTEIFEQNDSFQEHLWDVLA